MKIGLLTYYGDLNCGTNLQAYACLLALRNSFPKDDVEIIPIHGFVPPGVHPYFSYFTIKSLFNDFIRIKKYSYFIKNNLEVKEDIVEKNLTQALSFIEKRSYDMIFVGSDTILELDRISDDSSLSLYWLSPQIKSKKILLAASSKNVNYEGLSENQKSQMMLSLNDFIGFGVRDENTFDLVASFIPKEKLELIPDPTFSLEIDDRITDEYLKKKQILIPQKSLLFHTTKSDNKWAATAAKEYRGQGYKIYSLRPAPWADEVLNDMSPLEQLGIYRYFECVITHRFHDAVFCLKNMTPMLLYTPHGFSSTNGVKSKFTHLLDMFGLLQSNYMETPQDEIFLKMGKSISSFNVRRDKIATQLNDCSKLFYNYINQFK
ncbi:MAG: polysaccharide pyruvyl transferase family protein [Paludibacteraceae bacterium]|jgi:polysaccharide pyruvyl transferase WcaK-like protein|nr:polysaccharide pyruvyl transferase family protein [Paludibacteraceae bacterium]